MPSLPHCSSSHWQGITNRYSGWVIILSQTVVHCRILLSSDSPMFPLAPYPWYWRVFCNKCNLARATSSVYLDWLLRSSSFFTNKELEVLLLLTELLWGPNSESVCVISLLMPEHDFPVTASALTKQEATDQTEICARWSRKSMRVGFRPLSSYGFLWASLSTLTDFIAQDTWTDAALVLLHSPSSTLLHWHSLNSQMCGSRFTAFGGWTRHSLQLRCHFQHRVKTIRGGTDIAGEMISIHLHQMRVDTNALDQVHCFVCFLGLMGLHRR